MGSAVAQALRSRGHEVIVGARGVKDGRNSLRIDYMHAWSPEMWADRLKAQRVEAVLNAVGILMPSRGASFERVHTAGPVELFRGAVLAGVRRVVQVSALGVDDRPSV